ncbi:non-ribosomal peptide synthetase [Pedobacter cryoconitis]|uniref:non-ribosomal peptide synthetase n=1 Tax=Pedobacter cryoconitis TaxID=188932 RepID=UPI0016171009|nr:non-ribosomal peptide synthetase [Pedobacter cryoconitis]MBB5647625.1 amino acid adenylation domain-containing protein [Pedobacter cryoconitis]
MNTLITKLRGLQIALNVVDGKLKINAPKGVVTPEILADIQQNKDELIQFITNLYQKEELQVISPAVEKTYYKLSSAQKRMYFLYDLEKESTAYNMPQSIKMTGEPDMIRLQTAFERLVQRHESLRTIFVIVDEEPYQQIIASPVVNVACFHAIDEAETAAVIQNFVCPFDLSRAPLIRLGVISNTADEYMLLVDMHHIISDGLSNEILLEEFYALYEGKVLAPLKLQYKDYAEWQNSEQQQFAIAQQGKYWLSLLQHNLPVLDLPSDFQRVTRSGEEGGLISTYLTAEQYTGVQAFCVKCNITASMLFYSLFSILLSKLSGQEELILGLSAAGRNHPDLEKIIGLFVNSLPLKSSPAHDKTIEEFISEVRTATLQAYDNQYFQFDDLVNKLNIKREDGRNPMFDVMLNMVGRADQEIDFLNQPAGTYSHLSSAKRFDLTLNIFEYNNTANLQLQYDAGLFLAETAEAMLKQLVHLISALDSLEGKKISAISIESESRIQEIRAELNNYTTLNENNLVPASYHQERMWFIDRFESGYLYEAGPVYHNIPLIVSIGGALNAALLEKSIQTVINQYAILQTNIINIDEAAFQQVRNDYTLNLSIKELSDVQSATAYIHELINIPFELDQFLVRASLVKMTAHDFKLVLVFHHVIADSYTVSALVEEIFATYQVMVKGTFVPKENVSLSYQGFSLWQKEKLSAMEPYLLAYWKIQLAGKLKALELPLDRPRAAIHTYTADALPVTLSPELCAKLITYERQSGVAMNLLLMAAFKILLKKYAQQDEIIIGTSFHNRGQEILETTMGPVANLIVLKSVIASDTCFNQYLAELGITYSDGLKYGEMPFDKLVKELAPEKDMSRTALFDVLFQYETFEPLQAEGLELNVETTNLGLGKYDLNLFLQQNEAQIAGQLVFNLDYFEPSKMIRFVTHYETLLNNLLATPDARFSTIEFLTETEKEIVLKAYDYTAVAHPAEKTLIDLFNEQVLKSPDQFALKFADQTMTYRELDRESTRLAYLLQQSGVKANDIIGLLTDRSFETITGMLAILKSGGAYLPIDIDYPSERINYLIKDSGTKIVLTSKTTSAAIENAALLSFIYFEEVAALPEDLVCPVYQNDPCDLCYIIYTSGTTGNPKGVMIEHRNVVRLLFNEQFQFDFGSSDIWTMFHSHCFDFSVWEIYGALLFGGQLVIIPKQLSANTAAYLQILKDEKVTILNQTPGAFYNLVQEEEACITKELNLRYVIFGGEALSPGKLKSWHEQYPAVKLINMFGITETTVHVTYKEIGAFEIQHNISNIGTPIPTLSVYIFDENQRLLPQGVIGELYVGGAGVARGYLGRDELNAVKFITNPYRPEERLYRSGDLVRALENGELEYMGRNDDQVKIRGFRIELDEIAFQLSEYDQIKKSTVVVGEREGEKYIAAYYVSADEIPVSELRCFLLDRLPDYMMPAYFISMDHIPLTGNGKVDKKALPSVNGSIVHAYEGASNAVEADLQSIWAAVLKLDQEAISVTRSFFELGGHSLKAAVLVNRISKELGVQLKLKDIFRSQTIREMSLLINSSVQPVPAGIPTALAKACYVLSAAQKRMYFLYQLDKNSVAYNMPQFIRMEGELDTIRLRKALKALVERHESLRTVFGMEQDEPVQYILKESNFELVHTITREVTTRLADFVKPFNLESGPLLRAELISIGNTEHVLAIDMHHIVTDGVSNGLLVHDFMQLYQGLNLTSLNIQYKDYAEWQQSEARQHVLATQKEFWLAAYAAETNQLNLPSDYPRPQVKQHDGDCISFTLDHGITSGLQQLGSTEGATMYMILLSFYNILLGKLGNTADVVVGSPVAGREHADLEGIMGMFANTLALRSYPEGTKTYRDYLSEVKQVALQCFDNQGYQYEDLVSSLKIDRDTSRNPLFDVMFSYDNFENEGLELPGLKISQLSGVHHISKFDLTLSARQGDGMLHLQFDYSTALYSRERISRYAAYFQRIAAAVLADTNTTLSAINLLSKAEEKEQLEVFNNTTVPYPQDKTLIDLFEAQVARTPDHIALRCASGTLSYKEFNKKADQFASYLKAVAHIKPGELVGILLEREEYLMLSIYGILKAGAAYVPIDPHSPADRINTIISVSGISALVSRSRYYQNKDLVIAGMLIDLDNCEETIHTQSIVKITAPRSTDLAYVIYTSGSTGVPKGVMVEHHSVVNRLVWMQKMYPINETDVLLQKTPVVFDVSVWELFWWSFTGASLCLLRPGAEKEPEELISEIAANKITVLHFVPPMLQAFLMFLERDPMLKAVAGVDKVFASGEALKPEQVQAFKKTMYSAHNSRLINMYGPTEATVEVSYHEIDFEAANTIIPIGKPIDNIRLYIVDQYNKLVPKGVNGELCIAGAGLARGYLNSEELTAQKFIANPWEPGERLYKTGDVAYWLETGEIAYTGRIDFQVKLRGYRIDCGEIESHLQNYPGLQEPIVLLKEDGDTKYLAAYYVAPSEIAEEALTNFLSEKIPAYMIPAHYVQLDKLPLTTSGKVDRKALPDPQLHLKITYIKPINQIQRDLVSIWSEVLNKNTADISANANFFDLGGNSLSLMKLVNRINQHFDANLTVANMFRYPVISLIAEFLSVPDIQFGAIEADIQDDLDQMNEVIGLLNHN